MLELSRKDFEQLVNRLEAIVHLCADAINTQEIKRKAEESLSMFVGRKLTTTDEIQHEDGTGIYWDVPHEIVRTPKGKLKIRKLEK